MNKIKVRKGHGDLVRRTAQHVPKKQRALSRKVKHKKGWA